MDLRPVLFVNGILVTIMGLSMVLPMMVDLYFQQDDWKVFFVCIIFTAFFGGSLILSNAGEEFTMSVRQAFILTATSWISLAFFAALPFWLSKLELNFTDSFFEAMSGITTTGATIMDDLENTPPGILIWRSILQWLGGIGIIVMALSVLPFLKVGGMQLFRTESSEKDKAMPRAATLASGIGVVYVILTLACAIFYMVAGMRLFDAVAHSMTTVATGGFSTFDTSFGHYDGVGIELVAMTFMVLGGLPFVLYLRAARGDISALLKDIQVIWFLSLVFGVILVLSAYLNFVNDVELLEAVRRVAFSSISVITGTGYSNASYDLWGAFPLTIFLFLMVIGGCAGSTTCGIKIFRFQVLYSVAITQVRRLLQPSGVFIAHYAGKPLPKDVPISVMSFFFLYAASFALLAIALALTGVDFITAISGAVTSISNVGPGLGPTIGPAGTYASLPESAKWILSMGMLLGRLELFTILVMLFPQFWHR